MRHLIAVAPDKFSPGLERISEVVPVSYSQCDLRDALLSEYQSDAHFVAYIVDGATKQPRLNKGVWPELDEHNRSILSIHALVCDSDNEDHCAWDDKLRNAARAQEASTPALKTCGIYETRGGRRIIQPLATPIPLERAEEYLSRWLDTLEEQGVEVDRACKDWTRHFRLPNVRRDGSDYRSPYVNLDRMTPIELDPLPERTVVTSVPPVVVQRDSPLSERAERARAYLANTPPAVEGAGGDAFTWTICNAIARGFDLCASDAISAMREWNSRCNPPWSDEELSSKLERARKNKAGETIGGRLARRTDPTPGPDIIMDIDPKFLLREPGCDDVSAEERAPDTVADALPAKPPKKERPRFEFIHGPEIVMKKITAPLWLVGKILPESGVCVIGGEPKATKTWAMLEIGMALATGTPAFGCDKYVVNKRRNVMVFLAEDGERSLQARIAALASSRNMGQCAAVDNMWFQCRGQLNLLSRDDVSDLIETCRKVPDLGLVALDPLRDLHNAEENDSTAMAKVTSVLRALRDELGCSIVFVHHAAKAGENTANRRPGQRLRGSSVLHGAVDAGIYLSKTETDLQTYWKNECAVEIKEGAGAGVFDLTLELCNDNDGRASSGGWVVEEREKKPAKAADEGARSKVVACLQSTSRAMGIRKIRDACKLGHNTLSDILHALKEDGIVEDTGTGWKMAFQQNQAVNPSTPVNRNSAPKLTGQNVKNGDSGETHHLFNVDGLSVGNQGTNERSVTLSTTRQLAVNVDGHGTDPSPIISPIYIGDDGDGCANRKRKETKKQDCLSKSERAELLAIIKAQSNNED